MSAVTTTTQNFVLALRKAALLTTAQDSKLAEFQRTSADVRALARQLVDRGWLTSFQVNQVSMGRGAELRLGHYVLTDRLGEGGSGSVFKARHLHMNRIVALKLIRKELLTDKEVVSRFQREIQVTSTVSHPHIVHAYDAGPIGPNYFLVMEYVEGVDLARLIKQSGNLPVEQACLYIGQAALGLQHIHERGLVHRDIKPANLFLTGVSIPGVTPKPEQSNGPITPVIKILDLGLARLQRPVNGEVTGDVTKAGTVMMGTLDYMAPEQAIDFQHADIRADIYSLGCTFYYLLTARPPFPEGSLAQKLLRHQQMEPPPIEKIRTDLPNGLPALIRKMMAKKVEDRCQKPAEVAQILSPIYAALTGRSNVPMVRSPNGSALTIASSSQALVPVGGSAPESRTRAIRRLPTQILQLLAKAPGGGSRKRRVVILAAAAIVFLGFTVIAWPFVFRNRGTGSNPVQAGDSGGKAVFLSDLPEMNFQGAAFGKGGVLGHNGNGNLSNDTKNGRIIVKGILSRQGISMLAASQGAASVSYRLGKQYQNFKATVTLHDGGWMSGSAVIFTLIGDGKVLWQSKPIRKVDDPPQDCSVSVAGVDNLELQVTCSSNNNGVWPVWLDPQISK